MKYEISVTKREAHKVEEIVIDLEKDKKEQDIYIYKMNESIEMHKIYS